MVKDSTRMKLAYKDEQDIVDLASSIDDAKVCFYPAESDLSHRFLASVRSEGLVQRERPDFEDHSSSILLEAMMVDDHPRPRKKDKTRARESDALRELKPLVDELGVDPDAKVVAAVSSGLPTDQDHNYRAYVAQFTRTVMDHGRKVDTYRAERPGYELGFLILDESTAYFEGMGAFGPRGRGRPHDWFADSAFTEVLEQSGADCVVWLTPYKRIEAEGGYLPLPTMTIIDVGLLRQEKHLAYDTSRMVSSEK